jgi:hypothetical protein
MEPTVLHNTFFHRDLEPLFVKREELEALARDISLILDELGINYTFSHEFMQWNCWTFYKHELLEFSITIYYKILGSFFIDIQRLYGDSFNFYSVRNKIRSHLSSYIMGSDGSGWESGDEGLPDLDDWTPSQEFYNDLIEDALEAEFLEQKIQSMTVLVRNFDKSLLSVTPRLKQLVSNNINSTNKSVRYLAKQIRKKIEEERFNTYKNLLMITSGSGIPTEIIPLISEFATGTGPKLKNYNEDLVKFEKKPLRRFSR